jgi:hypothetical protein
MYAGRTKLDGVPQVQNPDDNFPVFIQRTYLMTLSLVRRKKMIHTRLKQLPGSKSNKNARIHYDKQDKYHSGRYLSPDLLNPRYGCSVIGCFIWVIWNIYSF